MTELEALNGKVDFLIREVGEARRELAELKGEGEVSVEVASNEFAVGVRRFRAACEREGIVLVGGRGRGRQLRISRAGLERLRVLVRELGVDEVFGRQAGRKSAS